MKFRRAVTIIQTAAFAAQNGARALQFRDFNNDNLKQQRRSKFDCGLQWVLYDNHRAGR